MNKIRIYHGSLEQVPMPEIRQPNRTLDYGCGFYTTTSLEQYGPVANDRVYAAFVLFESGILNKKELIVELKAYELIDQLLFHTPASLQSITFIESIEIPL